MTRTTVTDTITLGRYTARHAYRAALRRAIGARR